MLANDEEGVFSYRCLACFSTTEDQIGQYRIANKLNFPLFDYEWTAEEELLLFEGLETHGYGNWNDISEFIGTGKTREEVEEHYQKIYLQNMNFLPSVQILTHKDDRGRLTYMQRQGQARKTAKNVPKQQQGNPLNLNRTSVAINQPNKQSKNPAEVVGFMPRRGDFEIEYDNDAQFLLAQMQFNDDDTEQQKSMKFRLIDIYNHKLSQRIKRKQFVIERKLLDIREQMRLDKTRTKEEKEIYNLMKVVARFNTPQNHDKLVQGIIKEKQLRQRIAELKELQGRGLKNLGQVEDELDSKKKRDDKSKKRDGDSYSVDKSKTRRVARKDPGVERSDKKVTYISKEEQELCSKLNMTFKQYTSIKETIMREAVKMGMIDRDQTAQILRINRNSSEAVFDFLVQQQGLIESKHSKMSAES